MSSLARQMAESLPPGTYYCYPAYGYPAYRDPGYAQAGCGYPDYLGYPAYSGPPGYRYPTPGSLVEGYQGDAGYPLSPLPRAMDIRAPAILSRLRFRLCLSPVGLCRQSASEDCSTGLGIGLSLLAEFRPKLTLIPITRRAAVPSECRHVLSHKIVILFHRMSG